MCIISAVYDQKIFKNTGYFKTFPIFIGFSLRVCSYYRNTGPFWFVCKKEEDYDLDVIALLCGADGKIHDLGSVDNGKPTLRNGDIIFKPSDKGLIKLGGDDADKAILCTDNLAPGAAGKPIVKDGVVSYKPGLISTGADLIGTGKPKQGTFATKILVK